MRPSNEKNHSNDFFLWNTFDVFCFGPFCWKLVFQLVQTTGLFFGTKFPEFAKPHRETPSIVNCCVSAETRKN